MFLMGRPLWLCALIAIGAFATWPSPTTPRRAGHAWLLKRALVVVGVSIAIAVALLLIAGFRM